MLGLLYALTDSDKITINMVLLIVVLLLLIFPLVRR